MPVPSKIGRQNCYSSARAVQKYLSARPCALQEGPARVVVDRLKQLGKIDKQSGCLLDVGCGNGTITRLLAQHFDHTIGVDPSGPQIASAVDLNESASIEFKKARAEELPVEDHSVNVITVLFALHFVDMEAFLPECKRVLKPGGVALFYRHNLSKIVSADDGTLPMIDSPVKHMIRKSLEKARDMSHPCFHAFELHQSQFGAMKWADKSREVHEIEFAGETISSLGSWSRFYLSLPFYQELGEGEENPIIELVQAVKKNWSKQNVHSEDIKVKLVYKVAMITLR